MSTLPPLPDANDPTDPSRQGAAVGAFVAATLTLLIAFGVDIDPEQEAAILRWVVVAAPIATALLIRKTAWKPATVGQTIDAVEQAVHEGPPEDLSDQL